MTTNFRKSKDFALILKISIEYVKENSILAAKIIEEAKERGILVCLADDGFICTTSDDYIAAFSAKSATISVFDPDAAGGPAWLPIPITPPAPAERLLSYVIQPDRLQEALGDFDEGYGLMLARHGVMQAHRWYWVQVIKLIGLGLFEFGVRILKAWSGFGPN